MENFESIKKDILKALEVKPDTYTSNLYQDVLFTSSWKELKTLICTEPKFKWFLSNGFPLPDGEYKVFKEKYMTKHTFKNGKLNGECLTYITPYSNDNIIKIENYKDGKLHGRYVEYGIEGDVKGKIIEEKNHENGVLDGEYFSFKDKYTNPHLPHEHRIYNSIETGTYKNGSYHGERKVNLPSGKLVVYEVYDEGKKNKHIHNYDFIDQVSSIFHLHEDGSYEQTDYHTHGVVSVFKTGPNGKLIEYHNDGSLSCECNILNDKLHGEYLMYNIKGQVFLKYIYFKGDLVKMEQINTEDENYTQTNIKPKRKTILEYIKSIFK